MIGLNHSWVEQGWVLICSLSLTLNSFIPFFTSAINLRFDLWQSHPSNIPWEESEEAPSAFDFWGQRVFDLRSHLITDGVEDADIRPDATVGAVAPLYRTMDYDTVVLLGGWVSNLWLVFEGYQRHHVFFLIKSSGWSFCIAEWQSFYRIFNARWSSAAEILSRRALSDMMLGSTGGSTDRKRAKVSGAWDNWGGSRGV